MFSFLHLLQNSSHGQPLIRSTVLPGVRAHAALAVFNITISFPHRIQLRKSVQTSHGKRWFFQISYLYLNSLKFQMCVHLVIDPTDNPTLKNLLYKLWRMFKKKWHDSQGFPITWLFSTCIWLGILFLYWVFSQLT